MAETKRGRLGVAELVLATDTTVYSITDSMDAVVDVIFTNGGKGNTYINLAIVDGLAADVLPEDYIEYKRMLAYGESFTVTDIKMSDDEAVVAYARDAGVTVRVAGIEEDEVGSGRVQELIVTGAVTSGVTSIELNHIDTIIEATIADLSNHAGFLMIKDTSATGTAAHTVTATAGTFNGTNNILTLNALNEAILIWVDSAGNGTVIENVDTVAVSGT